MLLLGRGTDERINFQFAGELRARLRVESETVLVANTAKSDVHLQSGYKIYRLNYQ